MEASPRISAARAHARARRSQERRALRALAVPLLLVAVVPTFSSRPRPAPGGPGLVVGLAVAALVASFVAVVLRDAPPGPHRRADPTTMAWLALMTAAGVTLIGRQPSGSGELVVSLVAWIAGSRLAARHGAALVLTAGAATTVALALVGRRALISIGSSLLLAALLYLVARLHRRAQADRERAELAVAELEDARERELEAAAVVERGRIARELHDVLAHSLSGLALQLEGARLRAEREGVSEELGAAIAGARRLAAGGLEEARRAVRALHGDAIPGPQDLEGLVSAFGRAGPAATLAIHGAPRALPAEAGLAVYRAAQEALTNVARHSSAREVRLDLHYEEGRVRLLVTDDGAGESPRSPALAAAGSGYGLSAMRERAELLGGSATAGPTARGFRVELELPAP